MSGDWGNTFASANLHPKGLPGENYDIVDKPIHYNQGKVECIDAIESATINKLGLEAVCVANIIKYLWRYEGKGGLQDIKKAQWYLNKLLGVVNE